MSLNRLLLPTLTFQVTWFTTIWLACEKKADLAALPGLIFMISILVLMSKSNEDRQAHTLYIGIRWVLLGLCLGFLCERLLIYLGVFIPHEESILGVPAWLLSLWGSLYLLIPYSMNRLMQNTLLAILFGVLGAPISYLSGAKMGAMALGYDELTVGVYTGCAWGIAMALTSIFWRSIHHGATHRT